LAQKKKKKSCRKEKQMKIKMYKKVITIGILIFALFVAISNTPAHAANELQAGETILYNLAAEGVFSGAGADDVTGTALNVLYEVGMEEGRFVYNVSEFVNFVPDFLSNFFFTGLNGDTPPGVWCYEIDDEPCFGRENIELLGGPDVPGWIPGGQPVSRWGWSWSLWEGVRPEVNMVSDDESILRCSRLSCEAVGPGTVDVYADISDMPQKLWFKYNKGYYNTCHDTRFCDLTYVNGTWYWADQNDLPTVLRYQVWSGLFGVGNPYRTTPWVPEGFDPADNNTWFFWGEDTITVPEFVMGPWTITVIGDPNPIVDLKVNGVDNPNPINAGDVFDVSWSSLNSDDCTVLNNINSTEWTGINGAQPQTAVQDVTYTATCTGSGGNTAVDSVDVIVISAPTVTLEAQKSTRMATSIFSRIIAFFKNLFSGTSYAGTPIFIDNGDFVDLLWTVSGADDCAATMDAGSTVNPYGQWQGSIDPSDGSQNNVGPLSGFNAYVFKLECSNSISGLSDFDTVAVTVNAAAPICGDNIINQASEQCDTPDLGGNTCESVEGPGYAGILLCHGAGTPNKCTFNTGACVPPSDDPICDDGFDNDEDGLIDVDDPGCYWEKPGVPGPYNPEDPDENNCGDGICQAISGEGPITCRIDCAVKEVPER
jgi:hypothetical protein